MMDEDGRVVDFYIATKTMVKYSALMGMFFGIFFERLIVLNMAAGNTNLT